MKTKLIFVIIIALGIMFGLSSCKDKSHKHVWENYLVKKPTCTEIGSIEQFCEGCGEKLYIDVAKSDHSYVNGICSICGALESPDNTIIHIPMPQNANNQASWNMSKIYDTSIKFGFNGTCSEFLSYCSNISLDGAYIDSLGFFHTTVSVKCKKDTFNVPVGLIVGKVSPVGEGVNQTVAGVSFEKDTLLITYQNELQLSAGKLSNDNSSAYITGFGLNTNNELVIYYSDNTISFAGKLATKSPFENQINIVYRTTEGGYEVHSVLDESTTIIISPTHQGTSIKSIRKNAFTKISNSVKNIVIAEGIKIDSDTFYGLDSDTQVFLEGKKNEHITSSINSNVKIYEKGEWSYENGSPQPN